MSANLRDLFKKPKLPRPKRGERVLVSFGIGLQPLSPEEARWYPKKINAARAMKKAAITQKKKYDGFELKRYVEKAAPKVSDQLARLFQRYARQWGEQIANGVGLTKREKTIDQVLADIDVDGFSVVVSDAMRPHMAEAFKSAGLQARELIPTAPRVSTQLANDQAESFARERAAWLVGMTVMPDGSLQPSQSGYAISDAIRLELRRLTETALAEGWSAKRLADAVVDSASLSPERALLIARTELAFSHTAGTLLQWKASGVVTGKRSVLADTHPEEDICDDAADEGAIPLEQPFAASGTDGPPFHPNCLCALVPEFLEEEKNAEESEVKPQQQSRKTPLRSAPFTVAPTVEELSAADILDAAPVSAKSSPLAIRAWIKEMESRGSVSDAVREAIDEAKSWLPASKVLLKAYNPDQPRDPAGTSTGGQWVSVDEGDDNNEFFQKVRNRGKQKDEICKILSADLKDNRAFAGMSDQDRYDWVSLQINSWARTSGDHDFYAISLQLAAQREFKLDEASTSHYQPDDVAEALKQNFDQRRAFLRAMYDHTQAQLKEAGIKEVYLTRGVKYTSGLSGWRFDLTSTTSIDDDEILVGVGKIGLAPMSSYSTSRSVAQGFGEGRTLSARVPASSILSTFRTGFGCSEEQEVVVLGGRHEQLMMIDPHFLQHQYFQPHYKASVRESMSRALEALKKPVKKNWVPGEPQATTDITIEVDADLVNADWPKRTPDRMEDLEIAEKILLKAYNPDQPRDPAGTSTGGQWTAETSVEESKEESKFRKKFLSTAKRATKAQRIQQKIEVVDALTERLINDPAFRGNSREQVRDYCAKLIDGWAKTSGDHDPESIALQLAAQRALKADQSSIEHYGPEALPEAKALDKEFGAKNEAFIKAMYQNTQDYLKAQGIKELHLVRGVVMDDSLKGKPGTVSFKEKDPKDTLGFFRLAKATTAPLSSYSIDTEIARGFSHPGLGTRHGRILLAKVPVEDIVSTAFTGVGCLKESELVIRGGTHKQLMRSTNVFETSSKIGNLEYGGEVTGTPNEIMKEGIKLLRGKSVKKADWVGINLEATDHIFPDADLANADWPKRTPDRMKDLETAEKVLLKAYNPDQPRDPAGTSTGGQWTSAGSLDTEAIARGEDNKLINQSKKIYRDAKTLSPKETREATIQSLVQRLETDPDWVAMQKADGRPSAAIVESIVRAWDQASTNEYESAMFQQAVREEFNLKDTSALFVMRPEVAERSRVASGNPIIKSGYRAFVRAQYEATQDFFNARGISHVYLYRGFASRSKYEDGVLNIDHYPATSFSLTPSVAETYGAYRFRYTKNYPYLLVAKVSVRDVLSTPFTGIGHLPSSEMVIKSSGLRQVLVSNLSNGLSAKPKEIAARARVKKSSTFIDDEDNVDWLRRVSLWQTHPFHKVLLKAYNPDQPRDPAGTGTGGQWTSDSPFSGMSLDGKDKAKWIKAHQKQYDEDPEFRAAVDALTYLTQGSFEPVRIATEFEATGKWPSDTDSRDGYIKEEIDKPMSGSPLGKYQSYFSGQDLEEKGSTATWREGARAVNKAIEKVAPLTQPIYRGIYGRENIDALVAMKPGEVLNVAGISSFTADSKIAEDFSMGIAQGQGRGRARGKGLSYGMQSAVIEVEPGARGIPVSAISPWRQKEVVSRGAFQIVSITSEEKETYRGGFWGKAKIHRIKVKQL